MANENRIKHGRTAAERKLSRIEIARAERALDGHRVTPDEGA